MFSYSLLIACVLIVVATILYLFFWNRLIALLLGLLLRVALWNQGRYSVWIEFGAIHLSLIAGRLSFKGVRYHSSNQTIKIVKGQISWRYWVRSPAGEEDLNNSRIGGEDFGEPKSSWPPSCRIQVSLEGVEWFIYNRTSAYDNIVEQMRKSGDHPLGTPRFSADRRPSRSRETFSKSPAPPEMIPLYPPSLFPARSIGPPKLFRRAVDWVKGQLPKLDPTDLLPVGIAVTKGAIICGNQSTPNLLVVEFQGADGTYGIVPSRSKLDIHRQLLNTKFKTVSAQYAENTHFRSSMPDFGEKVNETIQSQKYPNPGQYLSYHAFSKLWRRLKLFQVVNLEQNSRTVDAKTAVHGANLLGWRRNQKSIDDATPVGPEYLHLEYAAERQILEAPELELLYYADVVGSVPLHQSYTGAGHGDPFEVGNGDLPPEWGVEIVVHGGFLRYGPWADRQRAELQRLFFPPTYQDLQPTTFLGPGDKRMWTALKLFIELRGGTTLHIPFRESSKDWQWDGQSNVPRPKVREAAHIHVKAGDGSAISYVLPMVVSPTGYEGQLEVHLDEIAVTSTLNDIRLLKGESCRVRCELPTPLAWNAERQWTFAVSLRQPVLYLIRDHINMFTDLAKDWSSGPLSDYNRFIPMRYTVQVDFHNYEINTYVNDHNIIDKPLLRDENALLTLSGASFRNQADIDSSKFRAMSTTVPFWIEAPNVAVNLTLPRWHTHATPTGLDRTSIGSIGVFHLDASYQYLAEVLDDNIDQLKLFFTTRNVVWKAFGWSLRHFMILRENYFGTFTHFSTLYEYLDKKKKGLPVGDPIDLQYRPGKSNMLQVELRVSVDRGTIVAPAGFPGFESYRSTTDGLSKGTGLGSSVVLNIPALQVHLRTHDYSMEMSLNVDVLTGCIQNDWLDTETYVPPSLQNSGQTFYIDGLDIVAHRLFGPQPRTSTYICIWEIHVGRTRVLVTALEAKILGAAADAFAVNFSDPMNAPAAEYISPLDPDVTFLKVSVDSTTVIWLAGDTALEIRLPLGLRLNTNDLAGNLHRKVTTLRLSEATVRAFKCPGSIRRYWLEAASLTVDFNLDMYSRPDGWRESARAQAEFVAAQDILTGRSKVLYAQRGPDTLVAHLHGGHGSSKAGLRLPHPQVPSIDRPRLQRRTGARPRRNDASVRLSHFSTTDTHMSESDSDEPISEAARDARLAKSRPTASKNFSNFEDNESIASGDESDNADLTENADDTESDGFEWFDELSQQGPSVEYKVASRYDATQIGNPALWDESPFLLIRNCWDSASIHMDWDNCNNAQGQVITDQPMLCENVTRGCDTTIFRVTSKRGIDIRLTSLVASVIEKLYHDMKTSQLAPELSLDAAFVKFIRSISDGQSKGQHSIVDAYVPSARIRLMQVIPGQGVTRQTSSHGTALLDLDIHACHALGYSTERCREATIQQDLKLTFADVSLIFGVTGSRSDRASRALANDFKFVSGIHLLPSTLRWIGDKVHGAAGPLSVILEHSSPQYVFTTALAIAPYLRSLQRHISDAEQGSKLASKQAVREILLVSQKKAMVDPLSTIQPSFLVQKGRPQKIRTSVAFKVLAHLRRSLRDLDAMARKNFIQPSTEQYADFPPSELLSLLEKQASVLVADPDVTGRTELLALNGLLSGSKLQPLDTRTRSQCPLSLLLESGEIKTSLWNESRTSANVFILDALTADISFRLSSMSVSQASRSTKSLVSASHEHLQQDIKYLAISLTLGNAEAFLLPHLLDLAQQTIRVWRDSATQAVSPQADRKPAAVITSLVTTPTLYVELSAFVNHCRVQAAAESLTFEAGGSHIILTSNNMFPNTHSNQLGASMSCNQSVNFQDIFFRARATAEMKKSIVSDSLASLVCKGGRMNTVLREGGPVLRTVIATEAVQLSMPRSALRLYRFVEEWKADYLPGIEATMNSFLSELQNPHKPEKVPPSPVTVSTIQAHLCVGSVAVELQIMPGTWLLWEITDIIAFARSGERLRKAHYSYGLQLGSQALIISPRPSASDSNSSARVKLQLPMVSIAGDYDGTTIQIIGSMAFFHVTLRPSHWDALVFVQQKFGQDFDDLLLLIQESRARRRMPLSPVATSKASPGLKFEGHLRMKGFRFGLQGLSSTLVLESEDIYSAFSNETGNAWSLALTDLALSFAPRTGTLSGNFASASYRSSRSAFVSMDIKTALKTSSDGRSLEIAVTKIHAVMQPSSISEIGDFVDHLQAELVSRKEERAVEMSQFREKTKSIMRSLEVRVTETASSETPSWIDQTNIDLTVKNLGVAFPLTLDQDPYSLSRKKDGKALRAFLFSVKSLNFGAERGGSGSATMKQFAFQFVDQFRQTNPSDFSGENHITHNRIIYPEVTAQVRSDRRGRSRRLRVAANVSGFILDLDSAIPDHVFSLVDVYRRGKERVDRFTSAASRPSASINLEATPQLSGRADQSHYGALLTSNVLASLVFLSGQVHVHGSASTRAPRVRSAFPAFRHSAGESSEGVETLDLPGLSVWTEYRATPASRKLNGSHADEASTLMFKSTIHSSQNTLRPTLLPFVTEVIKHIEERLRRVSIPHGDTPRSSKLDISSTHTLESRVEEELEAVSSLNISLSLRIDQSRLELTCQPDVNVIAGLNWDSGGFIVTISPGARRVTFTGSVGGLTVGLKHGFLSDDCVRLDARNLGFSVTFGKTDNGEGDPISSMSIVVDTEFSGAVRFSRLQDVLCFKAVWLDRIPVFGVPNNAMPSTPSKGLVPLPNATSVKEEFVTALLVRVRRTRLEMDLGQSISTIILDLSNVVFRTRLTGALAEMSLCMMKVDMQFTGNLQGYATVPDFLFQTMRRREDGTGHAVESNRLLELSMTTGAFDITLDSERQRLLYYHAEPLDVMVFDDWSNASAQLVAQRHQLRLSFAVTGSEIVAVVTVGTIPSLINYANKFKANIDAQREGASRESKAFRAVNSPKPDNPLSAVASAMIQSARTRLTEPESSVSYIIKQDMSLRVDHLRLTVFPRTVRDVEMAQFVGRGVHARLDRHVEQDGLIAKRDVHLEFSGITVSRFHQLNALLAMKAASKSAKEWLDALTKDASEAIIFGLPSMKMSMNSTETVQDHVRELTYDFFSQFIRRTDMKREDIYITLNMSLYSWLTILRKNFAREMDQVNATDEVHSSTKLQASSIASLRRKAGEQSFSWDTMDAPSYQESMSSPRPKTPPESGGPPNIRASTLGHTRSVSHASSVPSNPALSPLFPGPGKETVFGPSQSATTKTPTVPTSLTSAKDKSLIYHSRNRHIERLTMRQLGEATPDVMHPFFMKKSGFSLEDSLPQYVHEYATTPLEEIMRALLQLYSKQLRVKGDPSNKA